MTPSIQADNIQKIRTLIWTNDSVNDLLALEIIRANELSNKLLPELVAVAKTAQDEQIRASYLAYLEQALLWETYHKIETSKFSTRSKDIRNLIGIVKADEMLYTYFQRSGLGIEEMLKYGSLQSSKYRKEAFEKYVDQIKNNLQKRHGYPYLWIDFLTVKELNLLFQDELISVHPWIKISIRNIPLTELPPVLTTFKSLRSLEITNASFVEFPNDIFKLSNLEDLTLDQLIGKHIPQDWSALSNLRTLNFGSSELLLHDFNFVDTLPKLKHLDINKCKLSSNYLLMSKKKLPIRNWQYFRTLSPFPLKHFLTFASAIKRSSLSTKDQEYFFDFAFQQKNFNDLPELPLINLLKALCINSVPLRKECLTILEQWTQERKGIDSLQEGATLHILGTTNLSKKSIQAKLKEQGIHYSANFSTKVTHLLIGRNPKAPYPTDLPNLAIITENQLQKFFSNKQPHFIEQTTQFDQKELQENLLTLLRNPDANNVLIALEMLQSGGVPPELMEDLLVVQKIHKDSKVRSKARKVLELYAPADWLPLIRDKQHFVMIGKPVREQDINKKFKKVAKNTSVNLAAMLSLAIFKIHRRGLRYILYHFRKPHEWRTNAFQAVMDGTHFDYAAGLGFRNLKTQKSGTLSLWKVKGTPPFPVDVLDVIDKIESVNFHNCKFEIMHQSRRTPKNNRKTAAIRNLGSI